MRTVLAILGLVGAAFVAAAASSDDTALAELRRQAEAGDVEAQLDLARVYQSGDGTPQLFGEALRWYRRAADQGDPRAQHELGAMLLRGEVGAANGIEAQRWLLRSAGQGFPPAQISLALQYLQGTGIPRNPAEAYRWLLRAAAQGDPVGQRILGQLHLDGGVLRRDPIEAYKWFLLASARGSDAATESRDLLASTLSPREVAEGQRRAAAFAPRIEPGAALPLRRSGTGFFITEDGFLLTSLHLVENAARIILKVQGTNYLARTVKLDRTNDLALLQVTGVVARASAPNRAPTRTTPPPTPQQRLTVPGTNSPSKSARKFQPLPLADSAKLRLGDPVATIGFPNPLLQGREPKLTRGEINSLAGVRDNPRHFQVSTPVQPGNSGGPLFDASGNVVGMIVLRLNDLTVLQQTGTVPQNVNYALKSGQMLRLLQSIPELAKALPEPHAAGNSSTDWIPAATTSIAVVQAQ